MAAGILSGMDGLGGYAAWVRPTTESIIRRIYTFLLISEVEMGLHPRGCSYRHHWHSCLLPPPKLPK